MDWHNWLEFIFGIHSHDMRTWIILGNAFLTLMNFTIIVSIIVSIIRFRKKVVISDKSRIAYLEEFKEYVKVLFVKLDDMKLQLDYIEKVVRDQRNGNVD